MNPLQNNEDSENRIQKGNLLTLLTLEERLEKGENINGNYLIHVEFSQRELIEEDKFAIEYFGERSIRVKQKFHCLIKKFFERLFSKYDFLRPHVVLASCDFSEGYFSKPNFVGSTSGAFLVGNNESPVSGMAVLIHELGHYKLEVLHGEPLRTSLEFKKFYDDAKSEGIIETFKDGLFIGNDSSGHPSENPGELYASAFMIAELGFVSKYKEMFFPQFTKEQKQLAEEIFGMVEK